MIKFFKLVNGEEIVAEVEAEDGWCERLEMIKPYRNVMTNQGGMMLVPYPSDKIEVAVAHILFTGSCNNQVYNAYKEATGAIKVAKPSLQLPTQSDVSRINNHG